MLKTILFMYLLVMLRSCFVQIGVGRKLQARPLVMILLIVTSGMDHHKCKLHTIICAIVLNSINMKQKMTLC